MQRSTVTIVTPPASYPITLAEAKAWLKVDVNDDDALITDLIVCATEAAEMEMRRALITQTRRLSLDTPFSSLDSELGDGVYDLPVSALNGVLCSDIELPYAPLQSVTSVTTYDIGNTGTVFPSSNYIVDTSASRISLNATSYWPTGLRRYKSCEVVYVCGYGAAANVPSPIKFGIRQHVMQMYDGRMVCEMPAMCKELYRKYKIYA